MTVGVSVPQKPLMSHKSKAMRIKSARASAAFIDIFFGSYCSMYMRTVAPEPADLVETSGRGSGKCQIQVGGGEVESALQGGGVHGRAVYDLAGRTRDDKKTRNDL